MTRCPNCHKPTRDTQSHVVSIRDTFDPDVFYSCSTSIPCREILEAWLALQHVGVTFNSDESAWLSCKRHDRQCDEHEIRAYVDAHPDETRDIELSVASSYN
jgi:hypothetical protein